MSDNHSPSIETSRSHTGFEIAIIGLAGRFPGALNSDAFWQNLKNGVESISFFSDEELAALGLDPAWLNDPNYVKARGVLEGAEFFDASFLGYTPREAQMMDPQQRVFLECAWEALEHAGYDPERFPGPIGVYAGVSQNSYLLNNLLLNPELLASVGDFQTLIGNDKDFLATRVAYKLNLRGPAIGVQTACSTSLVAVHLACQSLLSGECDMALAGGVSIHVPQRAGHFYQEEGIASPDGHCRAFDARAQGTVGGNGVGIVVLKRLSDAVAARDCIHAVIKGSAINNDGSLKVGYTAPSVDGQAEVIAKALAMAEVHPETVSYIEAHGTGTALGDPIEIAALTQAFFDCGLRICKSANLQICKSQSAIINPQSKGFCAIGSVKTNVGHLDAAAGVTSLIKTVLALKHQMIPPSLHFETPNPRIDFAAGPFYVNTTLREWQTHGFPRRAGVSSFGIGGTNAHVVLEEAPPSGWANLQMGKSANGQMGSEAGANLQICRFADLQIEIRPFKVLLLSAKTRTALETATANLAQFLREHRGTSLADVAYTTQVGRKGFSHRRLLVCRDIDEAATALESRDPKRVFTAFHEPADRPVALMFPGQGAQDVNRGGELYRLEPTFREQVDGCCEWLKPHLGLDLRDLLYPGIRFANLQICKSANLSLQQTFIAQPALFVLEYALAKLWLSWGVRPQAMIGHSIGEYVAACLAGVFSLEDGLALVAARGRLMQQLPGGAMLAILEAPETVAPLLGEGLSIGAINAPALCVVSGPKAAVEGLERCLHEKGVACRRLHTLHAFHSEMMEPILEAFTERVSRVTLHPPQIPYLSNVTGTWITAAEATDASYWARHLRQTVRFASGVQELLKAPNRILLEVGPGQTLCALAERHPDKMERHLVLPSMPHPKDRQSGAAFLLKALGRLWLSGIDVDWSAFSAHERRHRLPLPTYPFERQRYWIDPLEKAHCLAPRRVSLPKKPDLADWFYLPSWKRSALPFSIESVGLAEQKLRWLVFTDTCGLGAQLVKRLEQTGQEVFRVSAGERFQRRSDRVYTINPRAREDYEALVKAIQAQGKPLDMMVHLWGVTEIEPPSSPTRGLDNEPFHDFYSLLFLAQALSEQQNTQPLQIAVVTSNMQEVTGEEVLCPEKAMVLGPCRVIPQEYPNVTCRSIDIVISKSGDFQKERVIDSLIVELAVTSSDPFVAYRGNHRWVQTFEAVRLPGKPQRPARLREGGVYLITGGLGGIGLELAAYLARTVGAKLVLTGRSGLPARDQWGQWLATHDEVAADNDVTGRKLRKVQALEEMGAEVVVASADVAHLEQMQAVITQTCEHFGTIHGVIHAAGITEENSFRLIPETHPADSERHFRPKVYGLMVLEKVLQGRALDFCLLFSSLSSVLGGLGFVAYSAANLFMDTFAHQHHRASRIPWMSVNWDGWQLRAEKEPKKAFGATVAELAMTPQEGVEAFQRVLSMAPVNQVLVSTADLKTRMNQWMKPESLPETGHSPPGDTVAPHTRPDLPNAYVAPRNQTEQTIADIWGQLFGIEPVGVHDDFFALGGHSLLATQLLNQLRQYDKVAFSLRHLFENPTVAGLAQFIESSICKFADLQICKLKTPSREDAADWPTNLDQLSDEEVEAWLSKMLAEEEGHQ